MNVQVIFCYIVEVIELSPFWGCCVSCLTENMFLVGVFLPKESLSECLVKEGRRGSPLEGTRKHSGWHLEFKVLVAHWWLLVPQERALEWEWTAERAREPGLREHCPPPWLTQAWPSALFGRQLAFLAWIWGIFRWL